MEYARSCGLWPSMVLSFILSLVAISHIYPTSTAHKVESVFTSNVSVEQPKTTLQTYIVFVSLPKDRLISGPEDIKIWYQSFLPETHEPSSRLVHSYHHVVTGFAARLSPEEVKAMEKMEGFVTARPDRMLPLHTTHTPSFLGLQRNLRVWRDTNYGEGVIIGVVDTGIAPNHPSFSDEGMPSPPDKWKGRCDLPGLACNKKVIGARNLRAGDAGPPSDEDGHGTHTSSTAAGNFVDGANVFGQASGTASGMAPLAHLAMYCACGKIVCRSADVLAAMDAAVEDGVDILSLSLGGGSRHFYDDVIAMGAFGASRKGIFVSCSAGNEGRYGSLSNEAPWILTVGASTTDRSIRATAKLGNKEEYEGESLFQPANFPQTLIPLLYAGTNNPNSSACESLDGVDVKGKMVLCERSYGIGPVEQGQIVKDAGGAAMISMNAEIQGYTTQTEAHVLPATEVAYAYGEKIKKYINSTASPMATILFNGTILGDDSAPVITYYSSRGPNLESPGILKPDIFGPGNNILAAWPVSVENETSTTTSTFNMISGTSMSCPHLSGVAALIKAAHPDWSPAAIKSAIMTTANRVNKGGSPILDERLLPADVFATGAGYVNPSKAIDPGLIYDLEIGDYIPYLCGLGYEDKYVGIITRSEVKCTEVASIEAAQLNMPSFSVELGTAELTYTRTVTNVGPANSTYQGWISPFEGVIVTLSPHMLEFSEVNQKVPYQVTFTRSATIAPNATNVEGALQWSSVSTDHIVTIPISVQL